MHLEPTDSPVVIITIHRKGSRTPTQEGLGMAPGPSLSEAGLRHQGQHEYLTWGHSNKARTVVPFPKSFCWWDPAYLDIDKPSWPWWGTQGLLNAQRKSFVNGATEPARCRPPASATTERQHRTPWPQQGPHPPGLLSCS